MDDAQSTLENGLRRFPKVAALWILFGQLLESRARLAPAGLSPSPFAARAMETYRRGMRACPTCAELWVYSARLLERSISKAGLGGGPIKARSLLESGRQRYPKLDLIWLESIRLEARHGNDAAADSVLAKALKAVPTSGLLWGEKIQRTPRAQQRGVAMQAIRTLDRDPIIITRVAQLFWRERRYDKARRWF